MHYSELLNCTGMEVYINTSDFGTVYAKLPFNPDYILRCKELESCRYKNIIPFDYHEVHWCEDYHEMFPDLNKIFTGEFRDANRPTGPILVSYEVGVSLSQSDLVSNNGIFVLEKGETNGCIMNSIKGNDLFHYSETSRFISEKILSLGNEKIELTF